jgi:hypothetical protein
MHQVHFFFFMPTSDFDPPMHIDELSTNINHYVAVTSLGTFSEKLNRLHTLHTTHGSRNDALK